MAVLVIEQDKKGKEIRRQFEDTIEEHIEDALAAHRKAMEADPAFKKIGNVIPSKSEHFEQFDIHPKIQIKDAEDIGNLLETEKHNEIIRGE